MDQNRDTSSHADYEPIIFVLDDDDAVRGSLELLLRTEGYCAKTFESVAKFLEGFAEAYRAPDCVILDVHLPDGDGRALGAHLAAERPGLPVILMSGRMSAEAVKNTAAGIFAFLDKPLSHSDLFEIIARAIAT